MSGETAIVSPGRDETRNDSRGIATQSWVSEDGGFAVDGIVYRIANTARTREASFRLVYERYLDAGLVEKNPYEMRVTPHQLVSTTTIFVALDDEQVVGTVSLVEDGPMGVPMESIYPNEVDVLRSRSLKVAEVSCLAISTSAQGHNFKTFIHLNAMMIQYAQYHGIDIALITVHPRHMRPYCRLMGFEPLGEQKSYPLVGGNPAVPGAVDLAKVEIERPALYDEFFGIPFPPHCFVRQAHVPNNLTEYIPVSELSESYLPIVDGWASNSKPAVAASPRSLESQNKSCA